jgi:ATP-dependent Clp protease adaptor protein ClpS
MSQCRLLLFLQSRIDFIVHTKGKGIAGTYTFEVAEQKQCEVLLMAKIEEHPLRVEVELE